MVLASPHTSPLTGQKLENLSLMWNRRPHCFCCPGQGHHACSRGEKLSPPCLSSSTHLYAPCHVLTPTPASESIGWLVPVCLYLCMFISTHLATLFFASEQTFSALHLLSNGVPWTFIFARASRNRLACVHPFQQPAYATHTHCTFPCLDE